MESITELLAKPFNFIINKTFRTGECPETFKISVTNPVFESRDHVNFTGPFTSKQPLPEFMKT